MRTHPRLITHPNGCPDLLLLDMVTDVADPYTEMTVIRAWVTGPGGDPTFPRPDLLANILQMIDNVLAGREATDSGDTP